MILRKGAVMERLTQTSNSGGVAFTFDLDITCQPSEARKILNLATKLKDYEDLEEQGLLLRLPCKNWMDIVFGEQETFFGIDESYIENPIREITVDSADRFTWYDGWKTLVLNGADENGLDWEFSPEDIGKTVFLTKAEAEAKLQELTGGENESSN